MAEKEQPTKTPTLVRAGERAEQGIGITEKQRASGVKIYFTPPQNSLEFATSVKATSLEQAQRLTGLSVPTETEGDEPTVKTDEGEK